MFEKHLRPETVRARYSGWLRSDQTTGDRRCWRVFQRSAGAAAPRKLQQEPLPQGSAKDVSLRYGVNRSWKSSLVNSMMDVDDGQALRDSEMYVSRAWLRVRT